MYIQTDAKGNLMAYGDNPFLGYTKRVVTDYTDYFKNPEKYIYNAEIEDFEENPNYKEVVALKEKERIAKLAMTKYDFFKYVCSPYGITYAKLTEFVTSSDEVAAAWNLCARVYRGDEILCKSIKKVIPVMTDNKLDEIFKTYGE